MSSVVIRCDWYKWNLALGHYKIEEIIKGYSFHFGSEDVL